MFPLTNKNSPSSLPLNLNDFFQLLCRNRKSLWELEQCLLNWTPPNSTAPSTPHEQDDASIDLLERSVSFRSWAPSLSWSYQACSHTCLTVPRHRAGRWAPVDTYEKARWLCCTKVAMCPSLNHSDSRGVRGRTEVLVCFVLNKMLRSSPPLPLTPLPPHQITQTEEWSLIFSYKHK